MKNNKKQNLDGNYSWQQQESDKIFESKYFKLRVDQCALPDGRIMPKYYVIEFPDWVQVVARDKNKNFIMVNQYRYPVNQLFTEFPGGSTHPSIQEDPLLAAKRELLEETGYESKSWQYLGFHYPNPALMNNKCHVYLADECIESQNQNLDPFEVLEVELYTIAELKNVLTQQANHSLMLATFQMVQNHWDHMGIANAPESLK